MNLYFNGMYPIRSQQAGDFARQVVENHPNAEAAKYYRQGKEHHVIFTNKEADNFRTQEWRLPLPGQKAIEKYATEIEPALLGMFRQEKLETELSKLVGKELGRVKALRQRAAERLAQDPDASDMALDIRSNHKLEQADDVNAFMAALGKASSVTQSKSTQ